MSSGGTNTKVLPFDAKHLDGIIPKHEINYTEISVMTGNPRATKGACKDHIELIFRKYADKARAGYRVDASLPHVGKLQISIGICAVIFNEDLIAETRGKTAINHMKRHHSAYIPNNLVNTKMLDQRNTQKV